jgi:hypothetical protein
MKGYRWMMPRLAIDRYKNTTRENMPTDETITSFADRLIDLAERAISNRVVEERRKTARSRTKPRQKPTRSAHGEPREQTAAPAKLGRDPAMTTPRSRNKWPGPRIMPSV